MAVTSIRAFRWEDIPGLAQLYGQVWGFQPDLSVSPEVLARWMELPIYQPETNCFLACLDTRIVGYVLVAHERPINRAILEGGVHPYYRRQGIGRALLQSGLDRARDLEVTWAHVAISQSDDLGRRLLCNAGLDVVRRYWHMRRDPTEVGPIELPAGVLISPFVDGEEPVLANIQNRSFEGSWGFSPNEIEDIRIRVHTPPWYPGSILLARTGLDAMAYCWTRIRDLPDARQGFISMTGVHPDHRGKGLGRVILRAGLQFLIERGVRSIDLEVDEENTHARALYFSENFRDINVISWYGKLLGST